MEPQFPGSIGPAPAVFGGRRNPPSQFPGPAPAVHRTRAPRRNFLEPEETGFLGSRTGSGGAKMNRAHVGSQPRPWRQEAKPRTEGAKMTRAHSAFGPWRPGPGPGAGGAKMSRAHLGAGSGPWRQRPDL